MAIYSNDRDPNEIMWEEQSKKEAREKVLDIHINEMDLSVRAWNSLKKCGIETVKDLTKITISELLATRNFGQKSLSEVEMFLESHNLNFKSENTMKIELIEEQKLGEEKWYAVYRDGVYIKGSFSKDTAVQYYNMIINDEDALKPKKIVLMSHEIEIPLQQTNS